MGDASKQDDAPWVGIDFGTTHSYACIIVDIDIHTVTNGAKKFRSVASIVSFEEENKVTVGEEARLQAKENPSRVIFDVKALFGVKSIDEIARTYKREHPDVIVKSRKFMGLWTNFSSKSFRKLKNIFECTFRAEINGKKYFATPEIVA